MADVMQVAVLNPGGHDRTQTYPEGAGHPDDGVHPPVNYHAYAACTGGIFCRDATDVPPHISHVLLLLGRTIRPALRALHALRERGCTVAVSWKESGAAQIAKRLDDPGCIKAFRSICADADGAIASTPETVGLYRAAGCRLAEHIPTPYPLTDARWDFSRPLSERSGVFIGTREWRVHPRAHGSALLQACATGAAVTVCNTEGWRGRRRLAALSYPHLRVIEGQMPYATYLRTMASCRVVFQQDSSQVPGQVAGDALLCRMPCLGGNGAIDRHAFEDEGLRTLLTDDAAWLRTVQMSQARAVARLAYAPVAHQIRGFFEGLRAQSRGV